MPGGCWSLGGLAMLGWCPLQAQLVTALMQCMPAAGKPQGLVDFLTTTRAPPLSAPETVADDSRQAQPSLAAASSAPPAAASTAGPALGLSLFGKPPGEGTDPGTTILAVPLPQCTCRTMLLTGSTASEKCSIIQGPVA